MNGVEDWGGYENGTGLPNAIVAPGGIVATLAISVLDKLPLGVHYIRVVDSQMADPINSTGIWNTGGDSFAFDATIPFTIYFPEPATMLLLAGALPFLRRRSK